MYIEEGTREAKTLSEQGRGNGGEKREKEKPLDSGTRTEGKIDRQFVIPLRPAEGQTNTQKC